jgi:hypothetical protein
MYWYRLQIKLSLFLTNQKLRREHEWGSWCIEPRSLGLDISLTSVVSFTSRPFYLRQNSPLYPVDWRLYGPQSLTGRYGDVKILDPTGTQTPILSSSNPAVFNLGYVKTRYINQNETQEPLEPWTSSDPRTHEDSSPKWGAGKPETCPGISLTGQNHINNW